MEYTIITGSTSGIGLELASIYAKGGHNLILIARRGEVLDKVKSDLETQYNVNVCSFLCDLSDTESVHALFTEINKKYQIKCLINNAGVGIFNSIDKINETEINYQTKINVISPMLITSLLINNLKHNNGSIINVCSILSYLPNNKKSVYVANKYALLGFSNSIRVEYPNVHVLTVHPATVKTSFFKDEYYKDKKVLSPELVAKKVYKAHQKQKRNLDVPRSIVLLRIIYFFFPKCVDRLNRKFFANK